MKKTALILAAGMGTRMGTLTAEHTKALLEVGGTTLLDRMVSSLRSIGFENIVVVGGYKFERTQAEVARIGGAIAVIENTEYTLQNLTSFAKGLDMVQEGGLLVVNADYIFSDTTMKAVGSSLFEETALYCSFETSGVTDDVMKVHVGDGVLLEMSKQLSAFEAIYTGMFFLKDEHLSLAREALPFIWDSIGKEKATVEHLLSAFQGQGINIAVLDVGPANWFEIDTAEELQAAREAYSDKRP